MRAQRLTSIVYLSFSLLVAFYNIFLNKPWVSFFILPFIISSLLSGKKSKIFEFVGLSVTVLCALFFMKLYVGIIGALILSVFFYTFTMKKIHCYIYLSVFTIIVFFASCFNAESYSIQILHASLDAGLYFISAFCIYLYETEIKKQEQEILTIDPKVLELIDEASSIAHEAIELSQKMQDGKK